MEIVMINEVVFVKFVIRAWRYTVALLFRLSCYRHPDLQLTPHKELQDMADFFNLREPKRNLGVLVHGFLPRWDYKESLADFVKDSHGAELLIPIKINPPELRAQPGTTEVVARRIMSQVNRSGW
jgi:hypothetical protein